MSETGSKPPKGKWFAAFWERELRSEPAAIRAIRDRVAGGARGRVLEVGCGVGGNFARYPAEVTAIMAIDPNPYMLERARRRAEALGRAVDLREARAEALPFAESSFDTVVSTLNFCSIEDPVAGLAEIRRVLREYGDYRFADHVRYANAFGALCQDIVTPVWSRLLNAGCHPNRDIESMIRAAGFSAVEAEQLTPVSPLPPMGLVRPHIMGVARN